MVDVPGSGKRSGVKCARVDLIEVMADQLGPRDSGGVCVSACVHV